MLKNIASMIVGALISAAIGFASAVTGTPPTPATGFGLVDGTWLNGLAGGTNYTFQNGITAAGTTQATATQLSPGIYLYEVDAAAASTGVALPPCIAGTQSVLYNNGAQTLTIYPSIVNNPATSAQDTINNGTSLSGGLASHASIAFSCAKNGVWGAS
jgi:hypothetical protein